MQARRIYTYFKEKMIKTFRGPYRKLFLSLFILVIAIRALLPTALTLYVNHKLRNLDGFEGKIADIDLSFLMATYEIQGFELKSTNDRDRKAEIEDNPMVLSFKNLAVHVPWSSVLVRPLVANVAFDQLELFFEYKVKPKAKSAALKKQEKSWHQVLKETTPFIVNNFTIHQGVIHLVDADVAPDQNMMIKNLNLSVENLRNTRKSGEDYFAILKAEAETMGQGKLKAAMKLNPLLNPPVFDLDVTLTGFQIPALNPLLRKHAKFDVESGRMNLYVEAASTKSGYKGYIKPLFFDLNVLNYEKEKKQNNPFQLMWESIVETFGEVFRNQPNEQLATRIDFQKKYGDTTINLWETVVTLLQNAFVRALVPALDRSVHL